ncbi:RPM1 interacting protein 4 [Hibiscus trionum]|uniref:RPM1 interacting protein 4 n=1 Tax=Hibiscus trionum TaxID=183268 RepID=A0A9W7LQ04_HIBTR|nr:RPM1 interacting protein 4 [Hibiscus trionum]
MSEAKLRSHVPKFGDWDNDDLPYTAYFENARKEKGGKIMNPNDPEDNPEAFMYMRGGQESNYGCRHDHDSSKSDSVDKHRPDAGKIMNPNDPEENPEAFMYMRGGLESNYDHQHAHVPLAADSIKSESADKHRPNSANRIGSIDQQRSARRQWNTRSESGSETGTGSDRTHLNHHRLTSSGPKNGQAGEVSFSASVSGQSHRNGNYEYKHQRTTSVPKFGEWDETDPTSGAGFTVIFNKVKEEKRAPPASSFATVAPEVKTMNYSDSHQSKCPTPSWGSKFKICCCLF